MRNMQIFVLVIVFGINYQPKIKVNQCLQYKNCFTSKSNIREYEFNKYCLFARLFEDWNLFRVT